MKTIFLTLLFLVLVAFSALAGIIVAQIPARTLNFETAGNRALDAAENAFSRLSNISSGKLESWLSDKLGQCQLMTLPDKAAIDPRPA